MSGLTWDEDDLECSEGSFWLSGGGIVLIITGVCVLITILILILC